MNCAGGMMMMNVLFLLKSTVTVAPWTSQQQQQQVGGNLGDTSTFDRLRDTCNKMFLRDGNLRGSSQFAAALSPTLPRVSHLCKYFLKLIKIA